MILSAKPSTIYRDELQRLKNMVAKAEKARDQGVQPFILGMLVSDCVHQKDLVQNLRNNIAKAELN